MKMKLSVEGRSFEVQVGDLATQPVVVLVDGERLEVWTDEEIPTPPPSAPTAGPATPFATSHHVPVPVWKPRQTDVLPGTENFVIAPIPGVIVSVDVQVGDRVVYGQVVCLLEAMKMRNPLRVAKPGVVTEIRVRAGQHVHYHEPLIVVVPQP